MQGARWQPDLMSTNIKLLCYTPETSMSIMIQKTKKETLKSYRSIRTKQGYLGHKRETTFTKNLTCPRTPVLLPSPSEAQHSSILALYQAPEPPSPEM